MASDARKTRSLTKRKKEILSSRTIRLDGLDGFIAATAPYPWAEEATRAAMLIYKVETSGKCHALRLDLTERPSVKEKAYVDFPALVPPEVTSKPLHCGGFDQREQLFVLTNLPVEPDQYPHSKTPPTEVLWSMPFGEFLRQYADFKKTARPGARYPQPFKIFKGETQFDYEEFMAAYVNDRHWMLAPSSKKMIFDTDPDTVYDELMASFGVVAGIDYNRYGGD